MYLQKLLNLVTLVTSLEGELLITSLIIVGNPKKSLL